MEAFSAAEISIIIHATEDKDKILRSLKGLLGIPANSFFVRVASGHWQNQILFLTSHLDERHANELYSKINNVLSEESGLTNLLDKKGNLYIRLDKQALCKGRLALLERDSVRIKFNATVKHKSEVSTVYRRRN
jgi:RNA binding exosome subunit